jgi:protein SCO1/2
MTKRNLSVVAVGVTLALVAALVWIFRSHQRSTADLPSIKQVPSFTLVTEERQIFTQANLLGKVTIVDFVFTTCGGICPLMSTKMSELQQTFIDEPTIQLLSVSVDPEYDTPDVLGEYADGYGAVSGKWIFLTGSKKEIYDLAQKGFLLGLDVETQGDDDVILHSQKFVLVDSNGTIRSYYDSDDAAAMSKLVSDARELSKLRHS